jgi:hypothetical protein
MLLGVSAEEKAKDEEKKPVEAEAEASKKQDKRGLFDHDFGGHDFGSSHSYQHHHEEPHHHHHEEKTLTVIKKIPVPVPHYKTVHVPHVKEVHVPYHVNVPKPYPVVKHVSLFIFSKHQCYDFMNAKKNTYFYKYLIISLCSSSSGSI